MPESSIYVRTADKDRLKRQATAERRTLAQMFRHLMDLYDATTPVQRARLLDEHAHREGQ